MIDKTTGEVIRPAIKTQYNAFAFPRRYERPAGVSLTVPDQALSIREIMDRYSRGLPINAPVKIPIYHGDDEFYPDPRTMDLADRERLIEENKEELERLQNQVRDVQKRRWLQRQLAFKKPTEKPDTETKKEDPND